MDDGAGPGTIEFWETRYQAGEMAWELGQAAPSLMQWFHAQPAASGHVTVLGCGRAHDAIALAVAGFDVTAIDFAPTALAAGRALAAGAGVSVRFIEADLFALATSFDGTANFVVEHTFLCALPLSLRPAYATLVARLAAPGGSLVGVFFTGEDSDGPPFGITPAALDDLLAPAFVRRALKPVALAHQWPLGDEQFGVYQRL